MLSIAMLGLAWSAAELIEIGLLTIDVVNGYLVIATVYVLMMPIIY